MKITIFKKLLVLAPLFNSVHLFSGGIISNGSRMHSKVVNLQGDHIELTDAEYVGLEKMNIVAWNYFKGTGLLKAPEITIKTKKFQFTGTIFCDISCVITTEQPFNHKMFKQAGKGKFTFVVKPMPDPIKVSVNGYDLVLRDDFERQAADCMKEDNIEKFNMLLTSESGFEKDKDAQSNLLNMACIFKAHKITEKMCTFTGIVNPEGYGMDSPLLLAASLGDAKIVQLLINAGANVNKKHMRHQNMTALILAADRGYLEVVKTLLKAGADASLTLMFNNARAIDCARANGHHLVVRYLNNPSLIKADEQAAEQQKLVEQQKLSAKENRSLFRSMLHWLGY